MSSGTGAKLIFALFIGVFYAVGFGLLGYGLWSWRCSVEAGDWPTTPGKILECHLAASSDSDGTTYCAQVKYEYTVNGQQYTNDKVAYGYFYSSGVEAHQEIVERLQQAAQVQVRYHPANPATAVLSYGLHRSIRFILIFALTWLAFVLGFTVIAWVGSQSDTVLLQNLLTR